MKGVNRLRVYFAAAMVSGVLTSVLLAATTLPSEPPPLVLPATTMPATEPRPIPTYLPPAKVSPAATVAPAKPRAALTVAGSPNAGPVAAPMQAQAPLNIRYAVPPPLAVPTQDLSSPWMLWPEARPEASRATLLTDPTVAYGAAAALVPLVPIQSSPQGFYPYQIPAPITPGSAVVAAPLPEAPLTLAPTALFGPRMLAP